MLNNLPKVFFGAEGVYDVGKLEKRRLGEGLSLLVELLPDVDVWDSSDVEVRLRDSGVFSVVSVSPFNSIGDDLSMDVSIGSESDNSIEVKSDTLGGELISGDGIVVLVPKLKITKLKRCSWALLKN